MKNNEKASLQILKIAIITVILILTCSIVARVFASEVNTVKLVFANNYELNVITTKNKVSDILEENHIVVLPEEVVFPTIDATISENKTIKITKTLVEQNENLEVATSSQNVSLEQVLGNYATIIEKIQIIEEIIPYQTITKNALNSTSEDRSNKVIQEGQDGLKRVTYKVKYQNDIEISRVAVKEEIIKAAVNKIVQITKVTSRSNETETRAVSSTVARLAAQVEGITPIVKTLNASAYTASTCDKLPTDKSYGITASGAKATAWYTVAAGKCYPMGTIIYIPALQDKPNGGWFVVQDRGGAITNGKLDIYMNTYNECIQFGRKNIECYIYVK